MRNKFFRELSQKPMPTLLALGFSSGLPLALTLGTLSLWLKESGISKTSIGLFGAVGIAYSFKFLWSPLIDNVRLPLLSNLLGRRRSWMLVSQILLILCIAGLGSLNPANEPWLVALFAALVAFCSATQDIVIDAYRVEMLTPERQGEGSAVAVLGYRLGMLASFVGAVHVATAFGWHIAYFSMAALVGVGIAAMLLSKEPEMPAKASPRTFAAWFGEPLREFLQRPAWAMILIFVALYKLPDAFLGLMANPYYLEMGFSQNQIADIAKPSGFFATIGGGFLGAYLVRRFGVLATLWIGGIACALGALLFIPLQFAHANLGLLAIIITLDNISGGISLTALVAYLSGLCDKRFTATQYALLSSLAAIGRTLCSTVSGLTADTLGWSGFFITCSSLSLPGLALLYALTRREGLLLPLRNRS